MTAVVRVAAQAMVPATELVTVAMAPVTGLASVLVLLAVLSRSVGQAFRSRSSTPKTVRPVSRVVADYCRKP